MYGSRTMMLQSVAQHMPLHWLSGVTIVHFKHHLEFMPILTSTIADLLWQTIAQHLYICFLSFTCCSCIVSTQDIYICCEGCVHNCVAHSNQVAFSKVQHSCAHLLHLVQEKLHSNFYGHARLDNATYRSHESYRKERPSAAPQDYEQHKFCVQL